MSVSKMIKFLEKNKVVLNEDLKNTITESFNIAVTEKTSEVSSEVTSVKAQVDELKGILKEAAEEIKALRTTKKTEVAKQVKLFEEKMVDKLSKYLDFAINKAIPQHLVEAQAKLEVYEPLVESIKRTFNEKGLKIDDKGFGLLKDARNEIVSSRKKLDEAVAEKMALEAKTEQLLGKYLLNEKCNGLTLDQKKKVTKIFEGASYEDIEKRFKSVRELVLTEDEVVEPKKSDKVVSIKKKQIVEDYSPTGSGHITDELEKEWARLV